MQLQTLALVRKRPVAQLLGIAVAAAFFMLSVTTAKADNLTGTYNWQATATGTYGFTSGGTAISPPSGTSSIGSTIGFCIDGTGCNSNSGLSGTLTVNGTNVTFTFTGSTFPYTGSFGFDLSGLSPTITGLTLTSGSLGGATITSSFTGSTMNFLFSTTSGFSALSGAGSPVVFSVTAVPEVSSGILLFSILLPGLLLVAWRRKEILGGSEA